MNIQNLTQRHPGLTGDSIAVEKLYKYSKGKWSLVLSKIHPLPWRETRSPPIPESEGTQQGLKESLGLVEDNGELRRGLFNGAMQRDERYTLNPVTEEEFNMIAFSAGPPRGQR